MPVRDGKEAVAKGDDLALLREADAPVEAAGGLRDDRATGAPAAAPDGAAAPVKEAQADAGLFAHPGKARLRVVQRPYGGQIAAVLAAVRVAEHDLLEVAARLQMEPVGAVGEERAHQRIAV